MAKRRWDLNTVYISERLKECLRPLSRCALTTVVAPMGYGKTTAVNWYLGERATPRATRASSASACIPTIWPSSGRACRTLFRTRGSSLLRGYACPDDAAGASLLTDDLCHALAGKGPCYIFIDDFHLLTDERTRELSLHTRVNRLPENVHLIVASRDRFLPAARLSCASAASSTASGAEQLRLNHTELSDLCPPLRHRSSPTRRSTSLLYSSEGWFSAIYLNLRTLSERGALPDRSSDIYAMFSAAMIDPLPPKQREFLAVMGLADEFTVEMAEFVTGNKNADATPYRR